MSPCYLFKQTSLCLVRPLGLLPSTPRFGSTQSPLRVQPLFFFFPDTPRVALSLTPSTPPTGVFEFWLGSRCFAWLALLSPSPSRFRLAQLQIQGADFSTRQEFGYTVVFSLTSLSPPFPPSSIYRQSFRFRCIPSCASVFEFPVSFCKV